MQRKTEAFLYLPLIKILISDILPLPQVQLPSLKPSPGPGTPDPEKSTKAVGEDKKESKVA